MTYRKVSCTSFMTYETRSARSRPGLARAGKLADSPCRRQLFDGLTKHKNIGGEVSPLQRPHHQSRWARGEAWPPPGCRPILAAEMQHTNGCTLDRGVVGTSAGDALRNGVIGWAFSLLVIHPDWPLVPSLGRRVGATLNTIASAGRTGQSPSPLTIVDRPRRLLGFRRLPPPSLRPQLCDRQIRVDDDKAQGS